MWKAKNSSDNLLNQLLMNTIRLCICFLGFSFAISAQTKIVSGIVVDSISKKAIPYVNIGIFYKNFGTITNEEGYFELQIPNELLHDSLTFSFVGFKMVTKPISGFSNQEKNQISLVEDNNALDEVVLISKKPKIKKIGIRSHNPLLWGSVQNRDTYDIVEFGKVTHLHHKPSKLLSSHLYLNGVDGIDSALVRLNFYNLANDKPLKRIVFKMVAKKVSLQKGWLVLNLDSYDIVLDEDFFMSFEIIPDVKFQNFSIYYGGKLGGGSSLARMSSQGEWFKLNGANVTTYVTVKQ